MFFRWQEKSLPPCIVGRKKRGHTLESDLLFLRVLVMRAPVKEVREFWGSSLGQTSRSSLLIFVPWFSYSLIFLFSRLKNFSPGVFYYFKKSEKSVSLVRVLTILIYVSGLKTFSLSVRKVIRIFYRRKCRRSTSRWSGSPSVGRSCRRWKSSVSSLPLDLMEIRK